MSIKFYGFSMHVVFMMVLFTTLSCNSKQENKETTHIDEEEKEIKPKKEKKEFSKKDIIGEYTLVMIKIKPITEEDAEKEATIKLDYCQLHNKYGFNKDGVWYLGGVANETCSGPDESGTWTLNGNILTINSDQSGTYQYTIKKLTPENLIVSMNTEYEGKPAVASSLFKRIMDE